VKWVETNQRTTHKGRKHRFTQGRIMCYRQLHRVELLRQAQEKDGKGKHKRKVVIRGIKPMGKQPATIEIPQ